MTKVTDLYEVEAYYHLKPEPHFLNAIASHSKIGSTSEEVKFQKKANEAQKKDYESGSRYFCESLFWASQPNQAAKKYATTDASGGPDSSASPRFDPTRGRN
ncbi:MAG: hypothetical protein Q8K07_07005, partial [Methylicorpusculum sp.]|uniref:hypothetical protein n=2 Tax=Methylicorpusculum sp. TaxID=2713644 RepID=UPI0027302F06